MIPVPSYTGEPEFFMPTILGHMSPGSDTSWQPWRSPSPLGSRRPTQADLAAAVQHSAGREDVLPYSTDAQNAGAVRVLAVGINPSPWTAAVNAPFARPGNRFWKSLAAADITNHVVDAASGLSQADERMLAEVGLGITNLVSRPTARADELRTAELRAAASRLAQRVDFIRPDVVAILGVTAFRTAFSVPRATVGRQTIDDLEDWPKTVQLWVLPNPSGLNAHENVATHAAKWRTVWAVSKQA